MSVLSLRGCADFDFALVLSLLKSRFGDLNVDFSPLRKAMEYGCLYSAVQSDIVSSKASRRYDLSTLSL